MLARVQLHFNHVSVSIRSSIDMPAEKVVSKASEIRKSTKPIMEKRRRARINNSLSELKNLILDALKKDNARHSKLEKADILEMTVKHLRGLQRNQLNSAVMTDPSVIGKYRSGFSECANEVSKFLNQVDGVDSAIKQRLLNHLSACLSSLHSSTPSSYPLQPIHVQVPEHPQSKIFGGVHVVPTRLASGEIAFLLPQSQVDFYSPVTVPISPALSSSSSPTLGSTGVMSPASSDRSSPESVRMPSPLCEPASPAVSLKDNSSHVWRPW